MTPSKTASCCWEFSFVLMSCIWLQFWQKCTRVWAKIHLAIKQSLLLPCEFSEKFSTDNKTPLTSDTCSKIDLDSWPDDSLEVETSAGRNIFMLPYWWEQEISGKLPGVSQIQEVVYQPDSQVTRRAPCRCLCSWGGCGVCRAPCEQTGRSCAWRWLVQVICSEEGKKHHLTNLLSWLLGLLIGTWKNLWKHQDFHPSGWKQKLILSTWKITA